MPTPPPPPIPSPLPPPCFEPGFHLDAKRPRTPVHVPSLPALHASLAPGRTRQPLRLPPGARCAPVTTQGDPLGTAPERMGRNHARPPSAGLLPTDAPDKPPGLLWSPRGLTGPVLSAHGRPVLASVGPLSPATPARQTQRTGAWSIVTHVPGTRRLPAQTLPDPPCARPSSISSESALGPDLNTHLHPVATTTQAPNSQLAPATATCATPSVLRRPLFRCHRLCPTTPSDATRENRGF